MPDRREDGPSRGNIFDPEVPYPGIPTTSDGAGTVVWVDTHITQAACVYLNVAKPRRPKPAAPKRCLTR